MSPTMALVGFVVLAVLLLRPILSASAQMSLRQRRETQPATPIEPARIFRLVLPRSPDSPSATPANANVDRGFTTHQEHDS